MIDAVAMPPPVLVDISSKFDDPRKAAEIRRANLAEYALHFSGRRSIARVKGAVAGPSVQG